MELVFQFVEHNSAEYFLALNLRSEVLRKPLGLSYSSEQLAEEKDQLHLLASIDGEVLACLSVILKSSNQAQIRQMAVSLKVQGQGIGKQIMQYAENHLKGLGLTELLLKARETAIPFYSKLGYEVFGEKIIEVTLPHWWMLKKIVN